METVGGVAEGVEQVNGEKEVRCVSSSPVCSTVLAGVLVKHGNGAGHPPQNSDGNQSQYLSRSLFQSVNCDV